MASEIPYDRDSNAESRITHTEYQVSYHLLHVADHLLSVTDQQAFLCDLTRLCVETLPFVQAALVWLVDRQQGLMRVVASHGVACEPQGEILAQLRFRPGESVQGMVLRRGEPLLIEGRARYRDLIGTVSPLNQAYVRQLLESLPREVSSIVLPLGAGDEVIGVLELLNSQHMPDSLHHELPTLQSFARIVTGGLRYVESHAQMHANLRRLEVFSAISAAVSTAADLAELMGNVLDVILNVVDATAGTVLLYNPGRATLSIGAQRGLSPQYVAAHASFPVAGAACEEAVRYGQPMSRPLLHDSQEEALIAQGFKSCLYLPLLAGGTVTGVVCVYGEAVLYDRVDIQSLMLMGSLVGFAIANVMLYEASDIERRRLMAVINGIAEGVVLCDGQGRLVMTNQTALALLSLETAPHQQSLNDMPDFYAIRDIEGEPLPVEQLPLARALSGEVFHDYRVLLRGQSGANTVMSFSGAPVYRDDDHTIEGAVVVFRDITASQKIERAKDEFLAVAAHELRSPLAAVRSYTDLLVRREQRRNDENSVEMYGLTVLAQQVAHMLRLVENILDVSRLDADQLRIECQPVDLVALAEQVLEHLRPTAKERQLVLDSALSELIVMCDQMRMHQILTNLVGNALRYSAAGTDVNVSIGVQNAAELSDRYPHFAAHAAQSYAPADQMAVIAVEDHGTGIPEEQHPRLFRRYERGHNRHGEGLGLGLYLSRELVMRHGGAIWFESVVNEGSTFYVALPLQPGIPACDDSPAPISSD